MYIIDFPNLYLETNIALDKGVFKDSITEVEGGDSSGFSGSW